MVKLNPRVGIESQPIHLSNLGCDLPDTRRQDLVAGRLGCHAEILASGDPHAALGIKDHLSRTGHGSVVGCVDDVVHVQITSPMKSWRKPSPAPLHCTLRRCRCRCAHAEVGGAVCRCHCAVFGESGARKRCTRRDLRFAQLYDAV